MKSLRHDNILIRFIAILIAACCVFLVSIQPSFGSDDSTITAHPPIGAYHFVPSPQVDDAWVPLRNSFYDHQIDNLALTSMRHAALNQGARNLPDYSYATMALLDAPLNTLPAEHVNIHLRAAHTLSPDIPYFFRQHLFYVLQTDPINIALVVTTLKKAIHTGHQWMDSYPETYRPILFLFMVTIIISTFWFLVVQSFRYWSPALEQLTQLTNNYFTPLQIGIILTTTIALPGILFASCIISALLTMIVLSIFQTANERIVTIVFAALIAGIPFIDDTIKRWSSFIDSPAQSFFYAQYVGCNDVCLNDLKAQVLLQPNNPDPVTLYTYLYALYRHDAVASVNAIENFLAVIPSDWPAEIRGKALTLKAVAHLAQQKSQPAIALLEQAEKLVPNTAAPYFNLWRIHREDNGNTKAQIYLTQASKNNLPAVVELMDIENPTLQSQIMLEPLSPSLLWQWHYSWYNNHKTNVPELISGSGLSSRLYFHFGLFFLIVLSNIIFSQKAIRSKIYTPCIACLLARPPASKAPNILKRHHCWGCSMDTVEQRAHNKDNTFQEYMRSLDSYKQVGNMLHPLLSGLIPGYIFYWRGAAIRGALVNCPAVLALLILFCPISQWISPFNPILITSIETDVNVIAWSTIIVAYLISNIALLRYIWDGEE